MALTKTPEEIASMKTGGQLLSRAVEAAAKAVEPGVKVMVLDKIAERVLVEGGGTPSFKDYASHEGGTPFPSTLCVSVNDELVHGLGNRDIALKEGDIVSLDCGVWYDDLCTDMAVTVPVGDISDETQRLLDVTKTALKKGIEAVRVGGTIADIGRAVETYVKPHGYGIVRALVGHGVGHAVHEPPHVPNFFDKYTDTIKVQDGMCLAIEPMLSLGDWSVETKDDEWTIAMADGSLSAHFEMTVAATKDGVQIITPSPDV